MKDWVMTPQDNYTRTCNITCPEHPDYGPIMPGWKCPFCHYPEREPYPGEAGVAKPDPT